MNLFQSIKAHHNAFRILLIIFLALNSIGFTCLSFAKLIRFESVSRSLAKIVYWNFVAADFPLNSGHRCGHLVYLHATVWHYRRNSQQFRRHSTGPLRNCRSGRWQLWLGTQHLTILLGLLCRKHHRHGGHFRVLLLSQRGVIKWKDEWKCLTSSAYILFPIFVPTFPHFWCLYFYDYTFLLFSLQFLCPTRGHTLFQDNQR